MSSNDDRAERIERIRAAFERRCREAGTWLSPDGRVSEHAAAALLDMAPGSLANRRAAGIGPTHYRFGGGGCRVSYALHDLAAWVEWHRAR